VDPADTTIFMRTAVCKKAFVLDWSATRMDAEMDGCMRFVGS
jgi:hypothetical protein